MIPPRYVRPVFGTTVPPYSPPTDEITATAEPPIPDAYGCDLCDISFRTEQDLSNHVGSQH